MLGPATLGFEYLIDVSARPIGDWTEVCPFQTEKSRQKYLISSVASGMS